ncbi:MAG TPA: hypothetical protein ENN33_13420 [Ignavibacteria bacterium]|nr:hypothetical protein [Ignavibacteria bacterium]
MKVLLIGEFSGFHRALKLGLQELGHEVVLAASPDGYKNIQIDINLWPPAIFEKIKILKAFLKQFTILKGIRRLKGYDVVQFISPLKFCNSLPIYGLAFNRYIYEYLILNNKKSFLSACGNDPLYYKIGKNKVYYNPIDAHYKSINRKTPTISPEKVEWNIELAERVCGVIPASYDYLNSYKSFNAKINVSDLIPMPIYLPDFYYEGNQKVKGNHPVKILHGISRPGYKGTGFISKALFKLKKEYKDAIQILTVERLPYDEYINCVRTTDILIDQCNSYGYGINTLIGLAYGKVVLSGAEPKAVNALNVTDCPVINIKPDAEHIYAQIKKLLDSPESIVRMKEQSRNYVEKVHDAKAVAKQYLVFWHNS